MSNRVSIQPRATQKLSLFPSLSWPIGTLRISPVFRKFSVRKISQKPSLRLFPEILMAMKNT